MGDIGWSPVDGWASGLGRNPRRGSYRPDEPGRHRGPPGGTFLPRAPMPLGFGPPPQTRPLHPQGFMPRGFGPPPQMRPHPGRDFGGPRDENHYDIEFSRFQRGAPPPPYSSSHGLRDFADMFGDLDLDRRGSSGGSKGGNGSHGIDRDGSRVSETPVTFPLSPSGKKIHCIIDTGASMTLVKRSALRRYFPSISVTRGVGITMSGISGKGDSTDERIMLPITLLEKGGSRFGRRVRHGLLKGNIWTRIFCWACRSCETMGCISSGVVEQVAVLGAIILPVEGQKYPSVLTPRDKGERVYERVFNETIQIYKQFQWPTHA